MCILFHYRTYFLTLRLCSFTYNLFLLHACLWYKYNACYWYGFHPDSPTVCKCVSDEERHLCLGVFSFTAWAVGSIPGSLIVGALFDAACLLHNNQQEQFGQVESYLVYNNFPLGISSLSLFLVCVSVSTILSFLLWISYSKAKSQVEEQANEYNYRGSWTMTVAGANTACMTVAEAKVATYCRLWLLSACAYDSKW